MSKDINQFVEIPIELKNSLMIQVFEAMNNVKDDNRSLILIYHGNIEILID